MSEAKILVQKLEFSCCCETSQALTKHQASAHPALSRVVQQPRMAFQLVLASFLPGSTAPARANSTSPLASPLLSPSCSLSGPSRTLFLCLSFPSRGLFLCLLSLLRWRPTGLSSLLFRDLFHSRPSSPSFLGSVLALCRPACCAFSRPARWLLTPRWSLPSSAIP